MLWCLVRGGWLVTLLCCRGGLGFLTHVPTRAIRRHHVVKEKEGAVADGRDGIGELSASSQQGWKAIEIDSPVFVKLRASGGAFVDKTSAIADLLCHKPPLTRRAFFFRPRKFGKTLTLDIMDKMLAAGELPEGIQPWPGYRAVDVDGLFGGLEVHQRLRERDPAMGSLLQQAHFVILLELGDMESGASLKGGIIKLLAAVACRAFDERAEAKVLAALSPGEALRTLIDLVPEGVPVAVLVDEYDAAILEDVKSQAWQAAQAGVGALRSLLMVSKTITHSGRIEHFVIAGVARFTRTSLFSGANNFGDLTNHPLLSAALGFSEAEIRATFGPELERLGRGCREGGTADDAVEELTLWYDGYCFDESGTATCFNPYPVLVALRSGEVTTEEMAEASGTNWLGLTPADVTRGVVAEIMLEGSGVTMRQVNVDLADLEAGRVDVRSLLLQAGLLTLSRRGGGAGGMLECVVPNQYASRSLAAMLQSAWPEGLPATTTLAIVQAVRERDYLRFEELISRVLKVIPPEMFMTAPANASVPVKAVVREAPYHVAVWLPLYLCVPRDVGHVEVEYRLANGRADGLLELLPAPPRMPEEEVWVIEVGMGGTAARKVGQLRRYMDSPKFAERQRVVGAVCVIKDKKSKGKAAEVDWRWEFSRGV